MQQFREEIIRFELISIIFALCYFAKKEKAKKHIEVIFAENYLRCPKLTYHFFSVQQFEIEKILIPISGGETSFKT